MCGIEYADLGHNYTSVVTKPTCTDKGYTTFTCSKCGYSYKGDEKSAEGHSYTSVVTKPTCTVTGYTTFTCTKCGYSYKGDEKPVVAHSYTTDKKDATCTEKGYTTFTCSVCKYNYKGEYKNALGHSMGAYNVTKQPTCVENGTQTAKCIRCAHTETNTIGKTEHNYQNGVCSICGKDKTKDCSCNCHKDGFAGFIWKILCFFYKIFKMNPVCTCGAKHY